MGKVWNQKHLDLLLRLDYNLVLASMRIIQLDYDVFVLEFARLFILVTRRVEIIKKFKRKTKF